jgi:predicted Zn-dependent protease
LREALFGNQAEARERAADALNLSNGEGVQFLAALALSFAGDPIRAETLADDLERRFPQNTIVQSYYLPTVRGQVALSRNNPPRAIEILRAAVPYDLSGSGALYPVYVRGESYLAAHRGNEATAEFHKIPDHPGIVVNAPVGALAHLGLARAYALSGDKAKAKSAYHDFLTLWKNADPDIPILKHAQAEYAKLNSCSCAVARSRLIVHVNEWRLKSFLLLPDSCAESIGATERHLQNAPTTPLAVGLGAHQSERGLPMATQQPRPAEQY